VKKRAVLHVAFRAPKNESIVADGTDVVPEIHASLPRWRTSPSVYGAGLRNVARASAMGPLAVWYNQFSVHKNISMGAPIVKSLRRVRPI